MTHPAKTGGVSRRTALTQLSAFTVLVSQGVTLSAAAAPGNKRLAVVLLRGGMDGLALTPPYGDKNYETVRGDLALKPANRTGGMLDLDGFFGLHPAAEGLMPFWTAGEMAVIPAAWTGYKGRSHFAAQDALETGRPNGGDGTGWLNRALSAMGGGGVAASPQLPLILRGPAQATTLGDDRIPYQTPGFFRKVQLLYGDDTLFGQMLVQGIRAREQIGAILSEEDMKSGRSARRAQNLVQAGAATGKLLASEDGPRVAVLEASGWDTHQNQGVEDGVLARRFAGLADGLAALAEELGPHWKQTAVLVMTEFGRTAKPNGTGGTDHGAAGTALLLGGGVKGGAIVGKWPGLAPEALVDGRDLAPSVDLRGVIKSVLTGHMGISASAVGSRVLPGSGSVPALPGLIA